MEIWTTKAARAGLRAAALAIPIQLLSVWPTLASSLDTSPSTYATQAVAASPGGGTIRVPASLVDIEYTTDGSAGSAFSSNFTVVFTLPDGVQPSGAVTALVTDSGGGNCPLDLALPGAVSGSTITFTVQTLAGGTAGDTCSISPNDLVLTGANSLQTPTSSTRRGGFRIAAQLAAVASNSPFSPDAAPRNAALASSANALFVLTLPFPETDVDTAIGDSGATLNGQPAPGRVFLPSSGSDQLLNELGGVFVGINPASGPVAADGFTPFTFDVRIPATLTLSGNFSGISSIFLDQSGTSLCEATAEDEAQVAGIIPGAISSGSATFTVPLAFSPSLLCEYASGLTVIGVNPSGLGVTASLPAMDGLPGTTVAATGLFAPSIYTVGTPYFVTYTGNFTGGYDAFVRVVNNSAAPIQLYANVQTDNGSLGSAMVETALAGFTNDLVPVNTIMTNAGVAVPNRASLILFAAPAGTVQNAGNAAFGPGAVGISHLLRNPDGTVVQLGGNESP